MIRRLILLAAASLVVGCGEDPPAAGCASDRDCPNAFETCVDGRCIDDGDPVVLDSGVRRDGGRDAGRSASPHDSGPRDVGPRDGGSRDSGARDGGAHDAGVGEDAGRDGGPQDAGVRDGGERDGGGRDGGERDGGSVDAGTPDSGARDGGPRDAGPLARGAYTYRRIVTPGIPSNAELVRVAIAPDDAAMIVAQRYDTLYVVDLATETSTIVVALPKDTNEPIRIESIAYSDDGDYVLIATTAFVGGSPEGRLFRAGPRLGGLTEVAARNAGNTHQSLVLDTFTGAFHLLSHAQVPNAYVMYLRSYDDVSRTTAILTAQVTSAGCNDVGIAADGIAGDGHVVSCGTNGGTLGIFDSTNVWSTGPQPGNTTNLSARPQRDYALAVSWSGGRLSRFDHGVYSVGFSAPSIPAQSYDVEFNDDGSRALVIGQFRSFDSTAVAWEFRHDFYATNDLTNVSIQGFDASPWLGISGVLLSDVAWRPGADCGYIVGGCSTLNCTRGYLIGFAVTNGRACP